MVGVCLTSIGLVKLLEQRNGETHVDEYLALNSIVFLMSALFSYFSLRPGIRPTHITPLERVADFLFISGLTLMVIITTLFAYQTI